MATRKCLAGQSLVEIALVLPILVILFIGIAEVGFFLFSHVQIANAARAGAREGSLCRQDATCDTLPAEVQTAVYAEANLLNLNNSNTTVNTQPASPGPKPVAGSPITVTVTYTHTPPFVSIFVPAFPAQMPIEHRVIMNFDK